VGSTSVSQSVTLTNSGGAALSVTSIALTGTNSGDFAQTNTCGSSVAAGANCNISVTFKPTASGSRTATVIITDSSAGSPHTVALTGTTGSGTAAAACNSTGAVSYTDLKGGKVSLPYGRPFFITGGFADVQLAGGALNTLITPQTVAADYTTSDGVQRAIAASAIPGTSWSVTVGKLSPDTSVLINSQFTGPLSLGAVHTILAEMLADPAYQAASDEFVQTALGKPASAQVSATALLSQTAATVVTEALRKMGLTPKYPDDLKAALFTTLTNAIAPIFNLNEANKSVLNPIFHVAEAVGLPSDGLRSLTTQTIVEKLKTIDYSKVSNDKSTQYLVKGIVDQFLRAYREAVGGFDSRLQAVLLTGAPSLAVGNDQATGVVCDFQKYAGFDVGGSEFNIKTSTGGAPLYVVDQNVATELKSATALTVNGEALKAEVRGDNEVAFLGGEPTEGLNLMEVGKRKFLLWNEERKLTPFERPYHSSYAVLVAIDDYDRLKDPKKRGKTGFGSLGKMGTNANRLKAALLNLGFPSANIITLYDDKADSKAITDVLESFWTGGARSDADRLLFYFGGHGSSQANTGFLVTYDYDPRRPTLTSVLMRDLTGRHSENISAHHFLIALDACSSGLALITLGDPEREKAQREKFRRLSIIRNDTDPKARNVLVAGIGDQPAVYDNGGIFTNSQIRGLAGDADLNHDGIIQFAELALFVKNDVAAAAGSNGVKQTVGSQKLDAGGAIGEILFILEGK
jgi:hypothetical protein